MRRLSRTWTRRRAKRSDAPGRKSTRHELFVPRRGEGGIDVSKDSEDGMKGNVWVSENRGP